jgi:hypothetical protein
LNIKPDSSFLSSRDTLQQDHIIFNPPAAAPSVYHTPAKFLPKDDPRRQLLAATQSQVPALNTKLPPPIHTKIPNNHLTEKDLQEILELKRRQPDVWTNGKLARKFGCSNSFISICLSYSEVDVTDRRAEMKAKLEAVKAKWGPRRTKAREDREKRYQLWFKDD